MHANTNPFSASMPTGAFVSLKKHGVNKLGSAAFHSLLRISNDDNAFTNRIHPLPVLRGLAYLNLRDFCCNITTIIARFGKQPNKTAFTNKH